MAGVVDAAGDVGQEVSGSAPLSECPQHPHSPIPRQRLSHGSLLLTPLRCLGPVLSSPIRVLSELLASTSLIHLHLLAWEIFINLLT